jgi:hypothetical protein
LLVLHCVEYDDVDMQEKPVVGAALC